MEEFVSIADVFVHKVIQEILVQPISTNVVKRQSHVSMEAFV